MNTHGEFDFLMQETTRLSENLTDNEFEREFILSSFGERDGHALSEKIATEIYVKEKKEFPNAPGVLFNVSKSGNTFVVRGFATDTMKESAYEIFAGNKVYLNILRLSDSELDDELMFFEFESLEQAEIIVDTIFNKRFPLEEDILCNISDPGFSWWYVKTDDGFRINFKNHKLVKDGERIKLGPLGDVVVATLRFLRLEDHFKFHMPLSELVINKKQFILKSTDKTHPILKELMNLFERGELSDDSALICELDETLKLYLKEVAAVRRMWLCVEGLLIQKPSILN